MTKQENIGFIKKLRMKSFGNQTISDNSLLDIGNGIILYPIEGTLIIFDCNDYKEIKRIFISFSLIKVIKKLSENINYLICCENGNIYILNNEFKIISTYIPKEINNVYSLDISKEIKSTKDENKIHQYISISHHSITKEDDKYYITHSKDALSLIELEINLKNGEIDDINFNKIFTKQSLNDFSVFIYKEEKNIFELISFYWDETNKYNIIKVYNINSEYSDLLYIDQEQILVGKDFNDIITLKISGDLTKGETHQGECFNNHSLINSEDGCFQIEMIEIFKLF
jgi:hypothetical protein